ncbi:MAG: 4-hydroxy-3-methylbut-2-enyl diphosphate reductase [Desulfovibrionaceae bacterium]
MRIVLAETAGFCMGVDLALTRLDSLVDAPAGPGDGPIHTLGPIIHNPQVLARYAARGVTVSETPADVPSGARVVIRAHGVTKADEAALAARGAVVTDATCPRVKKAQVLIDRHTADGRTLLLYGEADHPEVRGLLSYARGRSRLFDSLAQFEAQVLTPGGRYVLAAQTTQDRAAYTEMAARLAERTDVDVIVLETICDATRLRQREAQEIARTVEGMVVVGGRMSGNTRRLAQVCTAQGAPCWHVEIPEELPMEELARCASVGVTAGASTPRDLIEAVLDRLRAIPAAAPAD